MELNKIYTGDALEVLSRLPNNEIDMCVTSPPYWGLRDYSVDGQLGLEPDFNEYIDKLCTIFDGVKHVLKDTGTCWVNIGDSYGGSGNASGHKDDTKNMGYTTSEMGATRGHTQKLLPKSLIGIPFRFALEMINRGWILRNTIIWHKPNCMPSSVKDRFTVDFEYLFFFSKNKKYYFEQQFESLKSPLHKPGNKKLASTRNERHEDLNRIWGYPKGRNKRTVWTITTKPYKEAHFAVFPPELIETPIQAGCPQYICNKCEKPRIKEYKSIIEKNKNFQDNAREQNSNKGSGGDKFKRDYINTPEYRKAFEKRTIQTIYNDCGCNAGFHPGTVLDPFIGSGTTASVAKSLGRNYIGIELNPEYIELINKRINETQTPLTVF